MPLCLPDGMVSSMTDHDEKAVGRRLRAVKNELGYKTTQTFAMFLGAERVTVDAWLNGRAFPPVRYLGPLRAEGITLDWLFYNDPSSMGYARAIRLQAAMDGDAVPPAEAREPEVPVVEVASPEVARPRRKKSKAATS